MTETVKKITFDWLQSQETQELNVTEADSTFSLDIPKEVGTAQANVLTMPDDFTIYKAVHRYNPGYRSDTYTLADGEIRFNSQTLIIGTAIGGMVTQYDTHAGKSVQYGNNKTYFSNTGGTYHSHIIQQVKPTITALAIIISHNTLDRFIGEAARVNILKTLGIPESPDVVSHTIPLRITKILQQCVQHHLKGSMKLLYSQVKALEYLCELVEYLEHKKHLISPQQKQLNSIHELHEYLCGLEGKLPSLVELSQHTDMPVWTLNTLFTQEYGMTIHRYITKVRLEQAHAVILESDIAFKVLASKLGYSHVNHFINAFKREFGYPPGHLRKTA
ncbi:MAG: helix-turn-helix transcriptional regulator, partial [Gammaproteobacteria bacterium]|nr:helix-turn-helix transcriptional regulator [Gammaproteobacteria bacterium]